MDSQLNAESNYGIVNLKKLGIFILGWMYHDGVRILECFQILIFFVKDSCGEDIENFENLIFFLPRTLLRGGFL